MLWLRTVLILFLSRGWKQWWFWFNPNCQFASRWRCICFMLSWLHRAHDNRFVALRDWEPEIKQLFVWRSFIFLFTHVRLASVKLNLNPREKDLKNRKEHEAMRNHCKKGDSAVWMHAKFNLNHSFTFMSNHSGCFTFKLTSPHLIRNSKQWWW